MRWRARSRSRFDEITQTEKTPTMAMKAMNHQPTLDSTNEWIDESTPERVRNVPKMQRQYVVAISETFQTFSIPFFSCTITECRNAVPTSQGTSAAFSTASQA